MKKQLQRLFKDIWNIPNVLTIFRLVLIPVFAVLLLHGHTMESLGVFCLASLTDSLDGFIARHWNQITPFGKLMDPLADKLMVLTALICQCVRGIFPWAAVAIVAAKEIYLVAGSAVMLRNNIVVSAAMTGKVATCAFIAALILSFFHEDVIVNGIPLDEVMVWIAVVLSLAAMISYTISGRKKMREITQLDER